MRLSPALLATVLLAACGSVEQGPSDAANADAAASGFDAAASTPDAGSSFLDASTGAPDAGSPAVDAGTSDLTITGGDVSGTWCGHVALNGSVTVPAGSTLEICGGTTIDVADDASLMFTVRGTLHLSGSADSRIVMRSSGRWVGLVIAGTLTGGGLDISNGTRCLNGQPNSAITLERSTFRCQQSLQLANGGTFRYVTVTGGGTVAITGGTLDMADSVIDLGHPSIPPDCTDWAGGTAILDHVRFTGCHCSLHFNSTSSPITVTNSILDGSANAVMIARTTATFTGNNLVSTEIPMLDIGGGINANVAGNYWGGDVPGIGSGNQGQFTGTGSYSVTPIPGAGPR